LTGKVESGASVVGIVITDSSNPANTLSVPVSAISVDSEGNVSVTGLDLAGLVDGSLVVSMTVVDGAGNEGNVTNTAILDTTITAALYFDDVTEDDIVNAIESQGMVTLTGTFIVEDDTDAKDIVVTINGHAYTVKAEDIQSDGGFSLEVAGSDLASDSDHKLQVTAEFEDDAGNTIVIETGGGLNYSVDLFARAGTVTVDAITSDDVINAEESGQTITVSGKAVGGDISVGDVVKMTINGREYSTTVATGGVWALAVAGSDLAADTEFEVVVTSSDAAGNTVESKTTSTHIVDTSAPDSLVISLNTDSGSSANDNLTNDGSYTITGIESGATLEYFVDGEWITTAPTTSEGVNTVTVRQVDSAGNTSESSTLEFTLDTVAEVAGETVSMNEDSAEPIVINILANDESGAVLVPGSVSFDSEKGTVTVNEDGTLLFTPAADFSGEVEIAYQVIDEAGNTASATATVNVTPVTDVPTVQLTLEPTTTTTLYSVDLSNVLDGIEDPVGNPAGFTVTAYNSENDVVAISIKDSGTPTGFGVTGQAGNGADSEIGKQEKLVVELDKPASSATFELAWLNSHNETAVYTVKYSDGTSATFTIDGNSDEGGYDRIGDPVTVNAPEGKSILAIEFSTPTTGDRVATSDYLLHSVSYESAVTNYTVDITAAPTDTDHSENITELTVTTPEGTSLSGAEKLGTENGVTTWKISLNSGGFTNNVAIDPETGVVTVKGLVLSVPDDFDGELSVTATATAVDPGAAAVSGSATWENSAPELAFADGSDSVVISEDDLLDSDSAAANGASVTGAFSISDAEGQNLALSLVAPAEVMTSGGVTLVWTTDSSGNLVAKAGETEIIRVALTDTDGQHGYVVTLSGPVDHGDTTLGNAVTVDFGIAVNDGLATTTEYVSVSIEDSAPVAVNDEDSITVRRETFEVTGIEANWVSYQNGSDIRKFDSDDNDDGLDQIRWGSPAGSGSQSGYGFVDNDANLDGRFELNEDIVLGTFTHYNYPVYDGGAITAASMEVAFSITDDTGETQPVTLKVDFDHNETVNSSDALASRDIVTVKNTFVTFEWEGEVYTLQVVGFREVGNSDGDIITSIYTDENASTSYELVVRVVEGEGYSLPETTGNVLEGDDGVGADALSQDGDTSVVSVAVGGLVTESDANVGSSIQGQYGNLVLNADGSYTYQVTASVDKIPAGAQETFSYMIQDSDGSTSSATLSIDVGTNTAPVAQDDGASNALFAGLVGEYYGTNSQLNNISDFRALIESKEPDATFDATNIDYGKGSGDVAKGTNLQTFLGEDASTLSNDPSDNTDGGIHLQGYVYLAAGTYNFKVTADDGYQITINGEAVATVDGIQSENTTTHQSFTVTESGYQAIDMIWWDQGGDYVFKPVLSADGGATYFVLDASILSSTGETGFITSQEQGLDITVDSLLANDTDADGDALTVTSISNVQNGYAYMDTAGVIHFTPLKGFFGTATFDYTISDGKGGTDKATASISVTPDGVLPTVSVSTAADISDFNVDVWKGHSENFDTQVLANSNGSQGANGSFYINGDLNYDASAGDGSDNIVIAGNVNRDLYLDDGSFSGDGDDNLLVKGELNSNGSIYGGAGNDSVEIRGNANEDIDLSKGNDRLAIGGSVNSNAEITLGEGNDSAYIARDLNSDIDAGTGNDTVVIGGSINSGGDAELGSGDDILSVQGDVSGKIRGDDGNDTVIIKGNVWSNADIELGSGNDVIIIEGKLYSEVDGESGNDSIYLSSYTKNDYYNNVDNIKSKIVNFENIVMSDGVIKGDSSAFNNYNSSTFSYSVTVDIDYSDSTIEPAVVTLFGVPSEASLTLDGVLLAPNSDGSYDIEITNGQTTIDTLQVVSSVELPDLDITSSVSFGSDDSGASDDKDNYLIGSEDNDTLIGGAGNDILFGGDDQVSDIMTGGAGNDIFILNDTADVSNIDIITDFNAAEDALDLTDLLTGIGGNPGKDADVDAITKFLTENVKVTDGHVKVGGEDVAEFGSASNFDSNLDGSVSSTDSIKVIYNDQEYNINIDG
jgi:VCBS repeat-containing protein